MDTSILKENESRIEQQVKSRIKAFNRNRIGAAIPIIIFMAFLFLSPMMGSEPFFVRLSILCSALLLVCSVTFVLSFRRALLLFLTATFGMSVLLIFKQISSELFFILTLINAGALLISKKAAHVFTQSVTDEMETLNRLKIEATTDSLTQLLNRNGLEQALETTWAFCKRHKKRAGFLMVDIDCFKSYNDVLGHLGGDEIIEKIADSIKACFKRETDIMGRIGGDEFLIFLSDIDDEHIAEMAQTLSRTITDLKIKATTEDSPFEFLSVCIGVVTGIPQAYDLILDLYKEADHALYHAKKSGRNCISFNGNIMKNPIEQNEKYTVLNSEKAIVLQYSDL